jgi:hypothetical protein
MIIRVRVVIQLTLMEKKRRTLIIEMITILRKRKSLIEEKHS